MDLSEARGLVLFRVIRRGIGISRRLSVTDTVCAYRRLGCSPSNPSVSRTDQPPPEKESGGDGKGSSPETLKRLVLLVSQRRSFLSRNYTGGALMIWNPKLAALRLR